jgi:hypothetical protein
MYCAYLVEYQLSTTGRQDVDVLCDMMVESEQEEVKMMASAKRMRSYAGCVERGATWVKVDLRLEC